MSTRAEIRETARKLDDLEVMERFMGIKGDLHLAVGPNRAEFLTNKALSTEIRDLVVRWMVRTREELGLTS